MALKKLTQYGNNTDLVMPGPRIIMATMQQENNGIMFVDLTIIIRRQDNTVFTVLSHRLAGVPFHGEPQARIGRLHGWAIELGGSRHNDIPPPKRQQHGG